MTLSQEGYLRSNGHRVWYRVVGEPRPGEVPLLTLHGGPGMAHDYLEPLEGLATARQVVFYDQLGCGLSDHPHKPEMWSVGYFVGEVDAVRRALDLPRVHLLGQSWGGMVALEYLLTKPDGVLSLTLASSPVSIPRWMEEANRLRSELPQDVQAVLDRHEAAGTTDDPEYAAATMVFNKRHLCRREPWPDCVQRTMDQLEADPEVYHTMGGTSEFNVTGPLKDWDVRGRLHEITLPTLITSGRYDELTPALAEETQRLIPGSKRVLFDESSHMAHVEETERYLSVLSAFLRGSEVAARVQKA